MNLLLLFLPLGLCALLVGTWGHVVPGSLAGKLIINSAQEPKPMTYQFITEYWPTSLGQNYYIKPGNVVGSFSVESGTLHFRSESTQPHKPIHSKQNILFVAYAKQQPDKLQEQQQQQSSPIAIVKT